MIFPTVCNFVQKIDEERGREKVFGDVDVTFQRTDFVPLTLYVPVLI
jgi:hypothetical protein